ncbi:MAG TPA: RNA methyltransferase [Pseudomonadales bacterium]
MKLDDVRKLHQKKYREAFGCFIAEGEHLVLELQRAAQTNPALSNSELYVTQAYEHWPGPFRKHVLDARQFKQLADTETPQGILAVVPLLNAPAAADARGETAIYLHEVQDPGNLGTILRTLAWFGGFRLLLSPGSVDPYNPKAVRASLGALFHVPIELDVEASTLPSRYGSIACLDLQGDNTRAAHFADFSCYIFGNEARGVPGELVAALNATRFAIAGSGTLESLNLATAVNICAYELSGRT